MLEHQILEHFVALSPHRLLQGAQRRRLRDQQLPDAGRLARDAREQGLILAFELLVLLRDLRALRSGLRVGGKREEVALPRRDLAAQLQRLGVKHAILR